MSVEELARSAAVADVAASPAALRLAWRLAADDAQTRAAVVARRDCPDDVRAVAADDPSYAVRASAAAPPAAPRRPAAAADPPPVPAAGTTAVLRDRLDARLRRGGPLRVDAGDRELVDALAACPDLLLVAAEKIGAEALMVAADTWARARIEATVREPPSGAADAVRAASLAAAVGMRRGKAATWRWRATCGRLLRYAPSAAAPHIAVAAGEADDGPGVAALATAVRLQDRGDAAEVVGSDVASVAWLRRRGTDVADARAFAQQAYARAVGRDGLYRDEAVRVLTRRFGDDAEVVVRAAALASRPSSLAAATAGWEEIADAARAAGIAPGVWELLLAARPDVGESPTAQAVLAGMDVDDLAADAGANAAATTLAALERGGVRVEDVAAAAATWRGSVAELAATAAALCDDAAA